MTVKELILKLQSYDQEAPVSMELYDDDDDVLDVFQDNGTVFITNNEYEGDEK